MVDKPSIRIFFLLLIATLFSAIVFSSELLYPAVTLKALWFRAFVMLTLPLYLYLLLRYPDLRPSFRNPLTLALVAFLLFSLLSGIAGVNPIRSFWGNYERMGGVYHLLHLTLLYFYVLLLAKAHRGYFDKLLQLLVWLGVISGVYGILETVGINPWLPQAGAQDRAGSFQGNPIYFASFLILPVVLALYFWLRP